MIRDCMKEELSDHQSSLRVIILLRYDRKGALCTSPNERHDGQIMSTYIHRGLLDREPAILIQPKYGE